ncbi:Dihydroneopterin aldolase, partial [Tetrabaena socialis]
MLPPCSLAWAGRMGSSAARMASNITMLSAAACPSLEPSWQRQLLCAHAMPARSCWRSGAGLPLHSLPPQKRSFQHAAAGGGDWIHLTGMRFHGRHGVLPEETRLGQPFVVDAKLQVDTSRAGASDALADTVNYAAVYRC